MEELRLSRKIRVGLFITELGLGGAEKALALLARGLPRDEFEVHVACLFGPEPTGERLRSEGIPVEDFRMAGRLDFRAVWRCRSWIRDRRLDVVHAFLFHANFISRLARVGTPGPVLLNSQRSIGFESPLQRLLLRTTHRVVSGFTAVSEAVRGYTVAELEVPPEKVVVIRNGLDLAEFDGEVRRGPLSTAALGAPQGVPLIGAIGHMRRDRAKGYPTLVEAAHQVTERSKACFLVCGDGPLRGEVEEEIRARGVGERFRLLGARRDVPAFLKAMDLYVQASTREGLPGAILEAMAAGRPVVATDVGGVPEVVQDGVTGILVPPGRPAELAEAILSLLDSPDRAKEMGDAGRRRVESEFTAAHMTAMHRELYEGTVTTL